MNINNDFIQNIINLYDCDKDKEESQLKAEDLTKEYLETINVLGLNILYERHGNDYKSKITIPSFLWFFRLVDKDLMPILDERFPALEDIYKLMEDEGYTESEINKFKNLPNSRVKKIKKNMETVVKEGTASYDLESTNWSAWMGDKTIEAPLEAVTYWKNHTVTNDWRITKDYDEEYLTDKTVEEIKSRLQELITEKVGEPLVAQNVIPADFDQHGGLIINKNMKNAEDEDTFLVTDHHGGRVAVDGIEKAITTATEYRKKRAESQLSFSIHRKITEPDGYFAWRQETYSDYL